jgi:hypothetical protein
VLRRLQGGIPADTQTAPGEKAGPEGHLLDRDGAQHKAPRGHQPAGRHPGATGADGLELAIPVLDGRRAQLR